MAPASRQISHMASVRETSVLPCLNLTESFVSEGFRIYYVRPRFKTKSPGGAARSEILQDVAQRAVTHYASGSKERNTWILSLFQ